MNITEQAARLTELRGQILELAEADSLDADQETRYTTLTAEFDELRAAHDRDWTAAVTYAAAVDEVRSFAANPVNVAAGDGTRDAGFNVDRTVNRDVFDLTDVRSLDENLVAGELRSRGLAAIEAGPHMTDEQRQCATLTIEGDTDGTRSQWILEHGSPEYHEAFREAMRHPQRPNLSRFSERAALSLTGANGGYLVPFTLDPTVILTNNGATNPFRAISSIKTTTTNTWNGVTSAGVTAEWIAEATEVADASPTFTQPSITPAKADAYIQASIEVLADSAVSGELAMLIGDAKDRLEATAFATGSGSGQPYGVMTRLSSGTGSTASRVAGSSGAAGAADFVIADVYAVQNALPPRYRPNASWVAEQTNLNKIRQFATGSGPQHAFWADLGVAIPPTLLGRPVYESSAMDSTIVSGSNDDILVLGDFRHGYCVVDRMGLEMVYNPVVVGSSGHRPTGEVGWAAFWRVGADVVDTNAFRYLRV